MAERLPVEPSLFPDLVDDRILGNVVPGEKEMVESLAEAGFSTSPDAVTHFGLVGSTAIYLLTRDPEKGTVASGANHSGFGDDEYWFQQPEPPTYEQLTGYIHDTLYVAVQGKQELALRLTDAITDLNEATVRLILAKDISAIRVFRPGVTKFMLAIENGITDYHEYVDEMQEWHEYIIGEGLRDKPDFRLVWRANKVYFPWGE